MSSKSVAWRNIKRRLKKIRRKAKKWSKGRTLHILILVVCLGLVITAFVLPADKMIKKRIGLRWHFYCFMDDIFGLKCASCALARSLAELTKGHIQKAFSYYSLGPLIFMYLTFQIPYRLWAVIKAPKSLPQPLLKINGGFTFIIVALIVMDWLFIMGGQVI